MCQMCVKNARSTGIGGVKIRSTIKNVIVTNEIEDYPDAKPTVPSVMLGVYLILFIFF